MTEYELSYLATETTNLAYRNIEYWIGLTTALIVVSYLAAGRLPLGLFILMLVLYANMASGVTLEFAGYSASIVELQERLNDARAKDGLAPITQFSSGFMAAVLNGSNFVTLVLGSIGAIWYSIVTWRENHGNK